MNVFSRICRQCGGECCRYDLFLSRKDLVKLRAVNHSFRVRERGAGFTLRKRNGTCPFLKKGEGCVLPEAKKPLDCRLFPVVFKIKRGKVGFRANRDCKFLHEVPKAWIRRAKKRAIGELEHWSEEEKRSFSRCVGNRPELVPA